MGKCIYKYCRSDTDKVLSRFVMFHRFPDRVKDKERYDKWIAAIPHMNNKTSVPLTARLCSTHFVIGDYDRNPRPSGGNPILKREAIPSQFYEGLPYNYYNTRINMIKRQRISVVSNTNSNIENTSTCKIGNGDVNAVTNENQTQPATAAQTLTSNFETKPEVPETCTVFTQTRLINGELENKMAVLRRELKYRGRSIRALNERVKRLNEELKKQRNMKRRITAFEQFLETKKENSLVYQLLLNEMRNSASKQKTYSGGIKEFCVKLNDFSSKAYEYVRQHTPLPHPSAIRRWQQRGSDRCDSQILTNLAVSSEPDASQLDDLREWSMDVTEEQYDEDEEDEPFFDDDQAFEDEDDLDRASEEEEELDHALEDEEEELDHTFENDGEEPDHALEGEEEMKAVEEVDGEVTTIVIEIDGEEISALMSEVIQIEEKEDTVQ